MTALDLITDRLEVRFEVATEALRWLDVHKDQARRQLDHVARQRFDLAVGRRDVVFREVLTVEAEDRRYRLNLHTWRATWRPSPTRGVLFEERGGLVSLQLGLPENVPDVLRVDLTRAPADAYSRDPELPVAFTAARFERVGIHAGSGLLVYRELS